MLLTQIGHQKFVKSKWNTQKNVQKKRDHLVLLNTKTHWMQSQWNIPKTKAVIIRFFSSKRALFCSKIR